MIGEMENAILPPGDEDPGAAVAARVARRSLARRQSAYAEEVRRLLDAGLAVMHRAGTTSAPRVADIVREAGLSNDAFYRHFASKDDLVAAILEAGMVRLVGYLGHQMGKERLADVQVRRWVEGVMAQAGDAEVADATRAVIWNGGRAVDRFRDVASLSYAPLTELLVAPLTELGSADPSRDAAVIGQAAMGRMQEFLWRREPPSRRDVDHVARFCLAGIGRSA